MEDKVTYGYTHDLNVPPTTWSSDEEFMTRWATDDQPAKRPYYLVKRTETFDIIDIIGGKEYTDRLNER